MVFNEIKLYNVLFICYLTMFQLKFRNLTSSPFRICLETCLETRLEH